MCFDNTTNPTLKQCRKCNSLLPATLEYFQKDSSVKSGLSSQCRNCKAAYRKANIERDRESKRKYVENNREKRNESNKKYYDSHKERVEKYRKDHYEKNKDSIKEYQRIYRENNKEIIRDRIKKSIAKNPEGRRATNKSYRIRNKKEETERKRAWNQANKDKTREWTRRRRANRIKAEGSHTKKDIEDQYKSQKGKCYWCKSKLNNDYEVDHIIPLSRGGSDGPENICCSCRPCNRSKSNKLPTEWEGSNRLL